MGLISRFFQKKNDEVKSRSRPEFRAGQVWKYDTRPNEINSKVYIAKVETVQNYGKIFHICIDELKVKNPHSPSGFTDKMGHLPVSEEVLEKSLVGLSGNGEGNIPDISEGYQVWKEAFDKGEAGIFTIEIKNIIESMENVFSESSPIKME